MSRPPLKLRPAEAADAVELRRMLRALMVHSGSPSARPIATAELARHMGGGWSGRRADIEGVIAERGGRAVGMVLFFPWLSTWRGRLNLYVQDLYVEPEERGSGLGRLLLAAAAREGRARGCRGLLLAVETTNEPAARFYARLGFHCLAEERHWLLPPRKFSALLRAGGQPRKASRRREG
jgi:GNAT superfamily N-acetyltransferase